MQIYFSESESYSAEQIRSHEWPFQTSMFKNKVLEFCYEWLSGQKLFNVHTSGSTGEPKLITISREQMQLSAKATEQAFYLGNVKSILMCLNPEVIGGKMMLVRALQFKWDIYALEPSSNPLKDFNKKFDFAAFVPLQLQSILQESPSKITLLNGCHAIIVGGAEVNASLTTLIQNIEAPVYATYGMTETVSHIAKRKLNGKEPEESFEVLPEIHISQDDRGCLVIKAPVTNFQEVVTNDVVELIDDKHFKLFGRFDNVINSGGVKIQVEEIEILIEEIFSSKNITHRFYTGAVSDFILGQKFVLVLEGDPLEQTVEEDLMAEFKQQLPRFKAPRQILYKKEFELTDSGKIKRVIP